MTFYLLMIYGHSSALAVEGKCTYVRKPLTVIPYVYPSVFVIRFRVLMMTQILASTFVSMMDVCACGHLTL